MKRISSAALAVCIALLISCSQTHENVKPTGQNSLGLIVPSATSGIPSNLLLLKDGRLTNPTSGIPNFNQMTVGNKLSLTFIPGTKHGGIVDIIVTKFSGARDSTFVPGTPTDTISKPRTDTTSTSHLDSTSFRGTYQGIAYKASSDSSSVSRDTTSITFSSPNLYRCSGAKNYPASGAGTFTVWQGRITFTDQRNTSDTVLNGSFTFNLFGDYLYMWAFKNGIVYHYSMKRK
jgi:hypothetical protein